MGLINALRKLYFMKHTDKQPITPPPYSASHGEAVAEFAGPEACREFVIERYSAGKKALWDEFIRNSRNASFLFMRDYMDYHSDRFTDNSLLIYKGRKLSALLAANLTPDGILHSHQGLTYGGLLLPMKHIDAADVLDMFSSIMQYCKSEDIRGIDYKPLPFIYSALPSQEDLYALFRCGATLTETNLSSTIEIGKSTGLNTLQRRHLRKASRIPCEINEVTDIDEFWQLLNRCLNDRHNVSPVHSAAELRLLCSRFPENIKIHGLWHGGELQAGVCMFLSGRVAHCQYIATSPTAREQNLLTVLFDALIRHYGKTHDYFDFGISNENSGKYLNRGLLRQKFSYGATGVAYQRYYLPLPH